MYKHELYTPGEKTPEMHGSDHYGNVEMSAEELMAELAARDERRTTGLFELEAPRELVELSGEERDWDRKRMGAEGAPSAQPQQRHPTRGINTPASTGDARPFSWQQL